MHDFSSQILIRGFFLSFQCPCWGNVDIIPKKFHKGCFYLCIDTDTNTNPGWTVFVSIIMYAKFLATIFIVHVWMNYMNIANQKIWINVYVLFCKKFSKKALFISFFLLVLVKDVNAKHCCLSFFFLLTRNFLHGNDIEKQRLKKPILNYILSGHNFTKVY